MAAVLLAFPTLPNVTGVCIMAKLTKIAVLVDEAGNAFVKIGSNQALKHDNAVKHEYNGKVGFYVPVTLGDVVADALKPEVEEKAG